MLCSHVLDVPVTRVPTDSSDHTVDYSKQLISQLCTLSSAEALE